MFSLISKICVFILLFSACDNRKNYVKVVTLPDVVELTSTPIDLDVQLLFPTNMFIKGNKFIIFEPLSRGMFKVFDFPSFEYLYSFGDVGGGPNEFSTIFGNDDIIKNETNLIEILLPGQLKFVSFSEEEAYVHSTVSLPLLRRPISRLRKINDSTYYFPNWFDGDVKNEYAKLNILTGQKTFFSRYPRWVKNLKITDEKYMTYSKSSNYSETHKQIVVFYYHFPVIKFIDFEGRVTKEVHLDLPKTNYNPVTDNILYFTEFSFLTDEYIYVQWFGGKLKEEIMYDIENLKTEILVFDWDGNAVGRFQLDKPIAPYTISEETQKIYGATLPEEDASRVIYEYDLPKIENTHLKLYRRETSLYLFDFFEKNFVFTRNLMEFGIETIEESAGFRLVQHTFIEGEKDGSDHLPKNRRESDISSLRVHLRRPIDNTSGLTYSTAIRDAYSNVKTFEFTVGGIQVKQTTFQWSEVDPAGRLMSDFFAVYDFELDGVFVTITIVSENDVLAKYNPSMRRLIQSFQIKNSSF